MDEGRKPAPAPEPAGMSDAEMMAKMEETRKRLDEATRRNQESLIRLEEERVRAMLGGRAEAGQPPAAPKEETPKEYAARIARGELNEREKAARYA